MKATDLDHAAIDERKLPGWDDAIWFFFGKRTYWRNRRDSGTFAAHLFCLFLTACAITFFEYFPFKYLGIMFLIGANVVAVFWPIRYANESPYVIWVNVIMGTVGLLTHVQFGLTIFHFHLEYYLFWIYLVGGLLAVWRRAWNDVIWKQLERIASKYSSEKLNSTLS